MNICPNCGRSEGVHVCHILSLTDKSLNKSLYQCSLCGTDWTDDPTENEAVSEQTEHECYWCSHYVPVRSAVNKTTSMVLGLNNGSGDLLFVDPQYCPMCGKNMTE